MSVWYCTPSARPPAEANIALDKWRDMGYRIALLVNDPVAGRTADCIIEVDAYPGYAQANNRLIAWVLEHDPECDWVVCGGDDIWPDMQRTAAEIARECSDWRADTFGVMQPTGDRWEVSGPGTGAGIDRVAGSPWIGREFARRVNGGRGPYWPEYLHMFEDQELQQVALKLGCFWQRQDVTHYHDHWGRPRPGEAVAHMDRIPEHLQRFNTPAHWQKYKALFEWRKQQGFPGHEVIA